MIYEVALEVDRGIHEDYLAWLLPHIKEMEQFEGFGPARLYSVEKEESDSLHWLVHYPVSDRKSLEHYFLHGAKAMRGDGMQRFANRFRASRRVLNEIDHS